MSTSFPTNLDTFTDKSNGDTIQPAHVNDLQDAVAAIEAKVGVDGSSVATSLTKKVADLAALAGVLSGMTASTAELNIMDGVTATAAELNIMDGMTGSTAEINAAVDAIKAATTQGDLLVKGASAIERLAAVAATQYLKSTGVGAKPAYGKLALRDTGVKVVQQSIDAGVSGDITITGVGFQPSVAIILGVCDSVQLSIGFDAISTQGAVLVYGGTSLNIFINASRSIFLSSDGAGGSFSSFNSDGGVITVPSSYAKALHLIILFLP